jgi:hypothetical protein
MTQDEIIEMAQQCGLIGMRPHLDGIYSESLEAFAKLVAAKELEACAKLCETRLGPTATDFYGNVYAEAIRARAQADGGEA